MEVHFEPELQATLDQLVLETGQTADTLLADAMAGYVTELAETRAMLDRRYDDIKSGRVALLDGERLCPADGTDRGETPLARIVCRHGQ